MVTPVKFSHKITDDGKQRAIVSITARINNGWHFYDQNLPKGGPVPLVFHTDKLVGAKALGGFKANKQPKSYIDDIFQVEVREFEGTVTFSQQLEITDPKAFVYEGYLKGQACQDNCVQVDYDFSFNSKQLSKSMLAVAATEPAETTNEETSTEAETDSTETALLATTDTLSAARPLPFVEALRIYILPDHIALYDMMHEAKVTISYYELSERLDTEVSYTLLRDLLLGQPTYLADREYVVGRGSLEISLRSLKGKPWVADYMVNPQCQLGTIRIASTDQSKGGYLQGRYSYQSGSSKPDVTQLLVSTPRKRLSIQLKYSKSKELTPAQLQDRLTEPQGGYTTMSLDELLRLL